MIETSEAGWDSEMTEYVSYVETPNRGLLYYCGNRFAAIGVAERLR